MEVFEPIYKKYQIYLHDNNKIDFSDMLITATKYIETLVIYHLIITFLLMNSRICPFGRYKLITNLIKQNPDQRLFCVGDDWQSIYRFTGSDISIITEFEKYFGYTKRVDLDKKLSFKQ